MTPTTSTPTTTPATSRTTGTTPSTGYRSWRLNTKYHSRQANAPTSHTSSRTDQAVAARQSPRSSGDQRNDSMPSAVTVASNGMAVIR